MGVGTCGDVASAGSHAKTRVKTVETGARGVRRELGEFGMLVRIWKVRWGMVLAAGGAV